jgi:hypothetical protein
VCKVEVNRNHNQGNKEYVLNFCGEKVLKMAVCEAEIELIKIKLRLFWGKLCLEVACI